LALTHLLFNNCGSWLRHLIRWLPLTSCHLLQLRNQLLYRSKQRGWLELDLLVGAWAEQHLPSMNSAMLHEFSQVLEQVWAGPGAGRPCSTPGGQPQSLACSGAASIV
jgi:hypothetical protein